MRWQVEKEFAVPCGMCLQKRTFCAMLETTKESRCRCGKIESASVKEAKVQLENDAIGAKKTHPIGCAELHYCLSLKYFAQNGFSWSKSCFCSAVNLCG